MIAEALLRKAADFDNLKRVPEVDYEEDLQEWVEENFARLGLDTSKARGVA